MFRLLGEEFVSAHITKDPDMVEEADVDNITLENMKKYLDDVLNIALMKTDKEMVDKFVKYKSKQFLETCQDQPKQAVLEALGEIILSCNISEGSYDIMEGFEHFHYNCVPFPAQLRSRFWDILMEKIEKPRKKRFDQLSVASSNPHNDSNIKQEVIRYHLKAAGLEESILEVGTKCRKKSTNSIKILPRMKTYFLLAKY